MDKLLGRYYQNSLKEKKITWPVVYLLNYKIKFVVKNYKENYRPKVL